ncbi:uncharacterized protein YvpB [Lachnospiraceae bacterium PF1-21]
MLRIEVVMNKWRMKYIHLGVAALLVTGILALGFILREEEEVMSAEYVNLSAETIVTEEEGTEIKNDIILAVKNIRQLPELPNGCEATSLAMVLDYYSMEITKTELVDKYLDMENLQYDHGVVYGGNPEETYFGSQHP